MPAVYDGASAAAEAVLDVAANSTAEAAASADVAGAAPAISRRDVRPI